MPARDALPAIIAACVPGVPVAEAPVELVERKGLGHPDTIADLLAEAMSQALCAHYLAEAGRVLHYNVENGFLIAGSSTPAFGGGVVEEPIRFVYGDSATSELGGRRLGV